MFDAYDLKGKHCILQLDPEFLPYLQFCGIDGSPLFAKVYDEEDDGLWLETASFHLCPTGVLKLYDATGEAQCRAHIFIPAKAILSVVAFPGDASALESDPALHHIGFRVKPAGADGTQD